MSEGHKQRCADEMGVRRARPAVVVMTRACPTRRHSCDDGAHRNPRRARHAGASPVCARPTRGPDAVEDRVMPNAVRFHRVLRATPERVYRAFVDPEALVKWMPPHGFTAKVHHMDPRVGGTYKMSFTNFTSGNSHSFGGDYVELVPHERLRWTDRFDDPNLPGEMTVTVNLKKVVVGTEVTIVQEGLPDVIPTEACCLGWQESLTLLAYLVEAEIPG